MFAFQHRCDWVRKDRKEFVVKKEEAATNETKLRVFKRAQWQRSTRPLGDDPMGLHQEGFRGFDEGFWWSDQERIPDYSEYRPKKDGSGSGGGGGGVGGGGRIKPDSDSDSDDY